MKKNNYLYLLLSIGFCLLVGFGSSYFSGSSVAITYATLTKPVFAPPGYVFGPVWTILYAMMGVAFYLIWVKKDQYKNSKAIGLFIVQLILNFFWSIIFFGWQNIGLAFYEILTLLIVIIFTILSFYKISKTAAYLMIPYALWVAFATFLTYSILVLN